MMEFRKVKDDIVTILGAAAAGRFRVIGYQTQSKNPTEIKNSDRLVQVYYDSGQFPKIGSMNGSKTHDMTFEIDLSASAPAQGDLSILDNAMATTQQKAAAIAAIKEAADNADTKIDELIEYVFQILMDGRNIDLLHSKGIISNRWIPSIQKDTLLERGDLIVKTANLKYSCRVMEEVTGDIGTEPATVIIDSGFSGDTGSSGVTVENDNT